MKLRELPAWVVLGKEPGGNSYKAVVERSFSMDLDAERACIFWSSGDATSNIGGSFKIDGKAAADRHQKMFEKACPGMTFEVFDVHGEIPIEIDWDRYEADNEFVPNTLSGVRNKFNARNARFEMK